MIPLLTRAEVRKLARLMRAYAPQVHPSLPDVGWEGPVLPSKVGAEFANAYGNFPKRVVHNPEGYFFVW
jgi:hypothetical protein